MSAVAMLVADDGADEAPDKRRRIERPIDILAFVLAGNATFTLEGRTSRFTYRVGRAEPRGDRPAPWFVSVLAGPNNTADYSYLGMIRGTAFELTAKSKANQDAPSVKAFAWFWRALVRKDEEDLAKLAFWHEGRCGLCGRKLTVPESVERGIGPECAGKLE